MSVVNFDSSLLLNYYQAKFSASQVSASNSSSKSSSKSSSSSSGSSSSSTKKSATANDVTPWSEKQPAQSSRDAKVLSLTSFIDLTDVPKSAGVTTDSKTEQDNQKLFALYKAVNNLAYLAGMSKRDDTTDGQMSGYNTRFQAGLKEVSSFINSENFNNFTLQAQEPATSVTSTTAVANATFDYTGSVLADGNNVSNPLSGVTKDDSFTISVKKGSSTQDVVIDLSKVEGDLTVGNIVSYANKQLADAGVATRLQKVMVSGPADAATTKLKAQQQYALKIAPSGTEQITLTAGTRTPALYVAGTSGLTTATSDSAQDNQGKLIKLSNLSDPAAEFSRTTAVTSGTSTASSTVVDGDGNVYMLGSTTGDIGTQLNQGNQDVYLTKYDSAGTLTWSKLVGSAGTATGTAMALNPNGGVTIVGSTTAKLTTTSATNGNKDSFVTKYDGDGNQTWTTQLQTLNTNAANTVSVDSSGNVYIGGQSTGVIGSGQSKVGGQDAYLVKLDSKGKVASESLFGTTGTDTVSATAVTSNGDLMVASTQNGHAILSKYSGGDISQAPAWQMDLGDLQSGGTVGGIAISGDKVYVSGTTTNASLNATVASASSGGRDAFVFSATDNGTSVTSDHVSYVGTSATDQGNAVTVGSDGTVYLAGTTTSTFAGNVRNIKDTTNMFVASLDSSGAVSWVKQYGGLDGQSTGQSIAFDAKGASVLDSLGLPSGKITGKQNSYLASATTLRAGDSFSVEVEGDGSRTFKITAEKGETMSSLVTKINAQLGHKGEASVSYTSKGAALKIAVSAGSTIKLKSGSDGFDALGRLGIAEQTLSKPATAKASSTSTSSSSDSTPSYALGFDTSRLDISTSTGASTARASLLSVLSAVQKVYQTITTKASQSTSTTTTSNTSTGKASAAVQAQSDNYSLALSLLGGNSSSSTSVYG